MDVPATDRIGDGQLTVLREMLREHIDREGEASSFAMRSGKLMAIIQELEERRST